jgi:hypothetical protein
MNGETFIRREPSPIYTGDAPPPTGSTTAVPGLPVHGYISQPRVAIDRVNANKALEEMILRNMDDARGDDGVDQRWLAIARTRMEEAFMAYNRAIFQPQRHEHAAQVVEPSSS